jgi:hypothetical protein
MTHFSRWIAAILFCLLLSGILFTPTQARGYSTPPTSAASAQTLIPTNVHYTLHPADPARVSNVRFTLASPSSIKSGETISIRLLSSSQTWYPCVSGSTGWHCDTPDSPAVGAVDQMLVRVSE